MEVGLLVAEATVEELMLPSGAMSSSVCSLGRRWLPPRAAASSLGKEMG